MTPTLECQQCGGTDDVQRRFRTDELACWDCRKDDVFKRASQGGVDDRPVTGEYKTDFKNKTETVKSEESVGKRGQATLGDFE